MKTYWVYILCSKRNGTLYVGVTNDLTSRIYQHKKRTVNGFSKKYQTVCLVHAEPFQSVMDAIRREKCLKKWNRSWKIRLIEAHNPNWRDLYESLL